MFRPRVIPVLLIKGNGLVKTVGFKSPKNIGDPINAIRIFNKKWSIRKISNSSKNIFFYIPKKSLHYTKAITNVEYLEVKLGPFKKSALKMYM